MDTHHGPGFVAFSLVGWAAPALIILAEAPLRSSQAGAPPPSRREGSSPDMIARRFLVNHDQRQKRIL